MKRSLFIVLVAIILPAISRAQVIVPVEKENAAWKKNREILLQEYEFHKKLVPDFKWQSLEALSHFPELRNVSIKFRIKHSHSTAKTRPTILSMFLPKRSRTYVITISNKTDSILEPVMLQNLPYDAQVGLLGHELSHVADFSKKNFLQSAYIAFIHLFPRRLDKFEYNTDRIAVMHGLGPNLEAWSKYIRDTYHTKNWRGAGYVRSRDIKVERYMNPDTIEKIEPR